MAETDVVKSCFLLWRELFFLKKIFVYLKGRVRGAERESVRPLAHPPMAARGPDCSRNRSLGGQGCGAEGNTAGNTDFHIGAGSSPGYSTSRLAPCSRPGKAMENGSSSGPATTAIWGVTLTVPFKYTIKKIESPKMLKSLPYKRPMLTQISSRQMATAVSTCYF